MDAQNSQHGIGDAMLQRDSTFLMVIDPQEPLMEVIYERQRAAANMVLLIRAARILGLPIVVTVQNRDRLGDLIPEVLEALPPNQPVLNKMTFSCMRDPTIAEAVRSLGRPQALLCGVETHVCVHQTAHDLLQSGFQVHVAADAVSSRTQSNWSVAISRMQRAGIVITSAEMAVYELLERAGTAEFRAILPLVR